MKRSTNWKWLAILTVALVALSTPVVAQPELDLELVSVDIFTAKQAGEFQLRPNINIHNFGNLASHALDIVMHYGSIAPQLLTDTVTYFQQEHDCWQQSILHCGDGNCLDITTYQGTITGFCSGNNTTFMRCGCSYHYVEEYPWTVIEPGFTTVTIIVDPYNVVPEYDETNNTIVIDLMPIANETSTWSGIKSMYR